MANASSYHLLNGTSSDEFTRNPDSYDREVQPLNTIPGSEMTVSRFAQLLRTTLALEKIDLLKKSQQW